VAVNGFVFLLRLLRHQRLGRARARGASGARFDVALALRFLIQHRRVDHSLRPSGLPGHRLAVESSTIVTQDVRDRPCIKPHKSRRPDLDSWRCSTASEASLSREVVAVSRTMISKRLGSAAWSQTSRSLPRRFGSFHLFSGRRVMLRIQTILEDVRVKRDAVNQGSRTGWIYKGPRFATAIAVVATITALYTEHARARAVEAEDALSSCRLDLTRFCGHFTGRQDTDVVMFCLRDNFKTLRAECRRAIPVATERKESAKRGGVHKKAASRVIRREKPSKRSLRKR